MPLPLPCSLVWQAGPMFSRDELCGGRNIWVWKCNDSNIYHFVFCFKGVKIKKKCREFRCDTKYNAVCGTDSKTYINSCFMYYTSCVKKDKSLRLLYAGECRDEGMCIKIEHPYFEMFILLYCRWILFTLITTLMLVFLSGIMTSIIYTIVNSSILWYVLKKAVAI